MQLQPHFLFNALHTIGQLIRTGQGALAVRVLAGLATCCGGLLDGASTQEVPLKQELEFLRSYLDIEQIRFGDRLKAVVDAEAERSTPRALSDPPAARRKRDSSRDRAAQHRGRLLISARRTSTAACTSPSGTIGRARFRPREPENAAWVSPTPARACNNCTAMRRRSKW